MFVTLLSDAMKELPWGDKLYAYSHIWSSVFKTKHSYD